MKSFLLQFQECIKTKNQFEVRCLHYNQINLICAKYKAYCNSGLCRDERMTKAERTEFYDPKAKRKREKQVKSILRLAAKLETNIETI